MNAIRVLALAALLAPVIHAQGIRGVTRRTPTVVHGQTAAQFFAAGGVPLNTPTNVTTIPGAPNQAVAGRTVTVPANSLAARPPVRPQYGQQQGVQPRPQPAANPVPQPATNRR
jgi:hypothetical protein